VISMMTALLLALQWNSFSIGALIVVVLMGLMLVPFLIMENVDGKRRLRSFRRLRRGGVTVGAPTPAGAGDINPGRLGNPAPGQPDGQADPYGATAQRHGSPIQS